MKRINSTTEIARIKIKYNNPNGPQKLVNYNQPVELGYFSIDKNRKCFFNESSLKYFTEPQIPSDLNIGYPDKYVMKDSTRDEKLDYLLHCLQKLKAKDPSIQPKIVTWRGIMTKIICSPYNSDAWEFNIIKYNGCIYISEEKSNENSNDLQTYYGYKFESYCTKDLVTQIKSETDDIINNNVEYCSVFKSKLGKIPIVLGAEVDCIFKDKPAGTTDQSCYAELKTHRILDNQRKITSFERYKLLKVWAQSFLCGITKVIFGFRDDNGMLRDFKEYTVQSIWERVKPLKYWNRHVCLEFGERLLNELCKHITVDDEKIVYLLKKESGTDYIVLSKMPTNERMFIPDFYISGKEWNNN